MPGCVDFGPGALAHERRGSGLDLGDQVPYRVRFESIGQHEKAIAVPGGQRVLGQTFVQREGSGTSRLYRRSAEAKDVLAHRLVSGILLKRPCLRGESVWCRRVGPWLRLILVHICEQQG